MNNKLAKASRLTTCYMSCIPFGNRSGTKRLGFYGEVLTDSKLEPLGKAVDRAGFLSGAKVYLLKTI